MAIRTFYTLSAPHLAGDITVYGDGGQGWYEYRITHGQLIVQDTGLDGCDAHHGRQYAQPEIALRDALMMVTGHEDIYTLEQQQRELANGYDGP